MGREERECGFHAIKTITLYILLSVFIWVCWVVGIFVGIERVLASARIFLSRSYIPLVRPYVFIKRHVPVSGSGIFSETALLYW